MQKSRFQISLYVLIPIIFSGITIFAVIVTYQIVDFYAKYNVETPWLLKSWGSASRCSPSCARCS